MQCPVCRHQNPQDARFCNACGHALSKAESLKKPSQSIISERKHVTIMFSDMSGYTAMTERLDPEEVKEIMSQIFGEITQIIRSYEGFIERFIGDAVMAVFGVPKAHEDDPVRAIRAALAIHNAVQNKYSHKFEEKIGCPLAMHTGINTGLVITGQVDVEKGTHGLTGDAINLASRLEGIANAGEIVVGIETYKQVLNYFEFEALAPAEVKGKQQPIPIYKVRSIKKELFKTHRLQGLQASLTGRDKEMNILAEAAERLKKGHGSIIAIRGDAGTGKSRLKKEFKDSLELENVQWREGHAYSYTQNMPYYPLINLLTHAFQIEESDLPDAIRTKVEDGTANLMGEDNPYTLYIGSLFSLSYEEIESVSPEYWKDTLCDAIRELLIALMERGPTIVCFEDLHWADPSFIYLLKRLSTTAQGKALFIFTYRSHFSLFDGDFPDEIKDRYQEIHLRELSTLESSQMLKSLLGTENIPKALYKFVGQKAQGNPFYIEEMVNSLIESDILIHDDGNWHQTRQITEADIPVTIHGLLTARVDRLEKQFKRVLQEASVIGRSFLYRILEKISDFDSGIDQYLKSLENLDLIRMQSIEPELEYIFKHALTQEVVYNGLLKKERQEIHERIALAIEQLFQDRLPEFYENLAFHFRRGQSANKAVEYMMKAGQKSYSRFALEESHQYFSEAYNLLSNKNQRTEEENQTIIDLLIKWGNVLNCRGDFDRLEKLLITNEKIAKSIGDKEKLGMFYAWLGYTLRSNEKLRKGYSYLIKALQVGEKISNQKIIGYACSWLTWSCADMGRLDEAIKYGKRAQELIDSLSLDRDFIRFTLAGLGMSYFFKGECQQVRKIGDQLLRYGKQNSDIRCMTQGYNIIGWSHYVAGNYDQAIQNFQNAIQVSADLVFEITAHLFLGISYILDKRLDEAEGTFNELSRHIEATNAKFIGNFAQFFFSIYTISQGKLKYGLLKAKNVTGSFLKNDSMYRYASANHVLGRVYSSLAVGDNKKSLSLVVKNLLFLMKNIPFASKKAEAYFNEAIDVANKIGAKGILGQAYLDLGLLYKAKNRNDKAREFILEAVHIFDECKAEGFQEKAREALSTS